MQVYAFVDGPDVVRRSAHDVRLRRVARPVDRAGVLSSRCSYGTLVSGMYLVVCLGPRTA